MGRVRELLADAVATLRAEGGEPDTIWLGLRAWDGLVSEAGSPPAAVDGSPCGLDHNASPEAIYILPKEGMRRHG